jgi:predicted Zn-dependent peptidase
VIVERLSNHLHLVLIPDATVPVPTAVLAFRSGSRYETPGTAGFGRWWLESSLQGTQAAPLRRVLLEKAEDAGVELQHHYDDEFCAWILSGPGSLQPAGQELLQDLVMNALHRSANAIRKKLLAEWSSDQTLENLFREKIFGDHPLGQGPAARAEALRTASVADLKAYAVEWIHPENGVLVCLCPVGESELLHPQLAGLWNRWQPQESREPIPSGDETEAHRLSDTRPVLPPSDPSAPYFFPSLKKGPILEQLVRPKASLAEFRIGFMGDGTSSPQGLAQEALLEILVGQNNGRLRFQLDEHPDGLVSLESHIRSWSDVSWLEIRGKCPSSHLRVVLRDLYRQLFRAKRVPFEDREVERANRKIRTRLFEMSGDPVARALQETRVHLLGAHSHAMEVAVSHADLSSAARTLLVEDRMSLFIEGQIPRVDQGDIIQIVNGTLQ